MAEKIVVSVVDASGIRSTQIFGPPKTYQAVTGVLKEAFGVGCLVNVQGDTVTPDDPVAAGPYTYTVTGTDKAASTAASVQQTGSLAKADLCVCVLLEYNERQMQAELLVDTGCDMDINISAYKADQLGLPKSQKPTKLEMGQAASGEVRRRGVVKAAVLMEDDGPGVLENDLSFSYLEVWSDEPSMPGPHTTDLGSSGSVASQVASHSDGAGTGVLIIKVSPVKEGKDSKGFDAILGGSGMQRLGLGINKDTHKLYVKRRTCLHLR